MRYVLSCIMVFVLAAASFAGQNNDGTNARKEKCPVCGMLVSLFPDWNAKVVFADSTQANIGGPKDMFKYYRNMKKYNPAQSSDSVKAITVKDYVSKEDIDAFKAFYVIWSDVYGPMGHEPIPFENEADAKKFLSEHKGRQILSFKDITSEVIWSLDNPE
ncbi:MAG TPA: nitrous oxide reductase accessory protein NosL [Nitrospirota bacterium]